MSVAPPSGEGATAIARHSLGAHRETLGPQALLGISGTEVYQVLTLTPSSPNQHFPLPKTKVLPSQCWRPLFSREYCKRACFPWLHLLADTLCLLHTHVQHQGERPAALWQARSELAEPGRDWRKQKVDTRTVGHGVARAQRPDRSHAGERHRLGKSLGTAEALASASWLVNKIVQGTQWGQ